MLECPSGGLFEGNRGWYRHLVNASLSTADVLSAGGAFATVTKHKVPSCQEVSSLAFSFFNSLVYLSPQVLSF